MTIQELGALGEFVSAIAVIITLVYLAIQTRLTRKAAEESAKFASQEALRAVPEMYARYRTLTSTPELAKIVVKARTQPLDETERLLFSTIFEELIYVSATSYQSALQAASGHDNNGDVEFVAAIFAQNPLALEVWVDHSVIAEAISSEFVAKLNRKLLDFSSLADNASKENV